MLDNQGPWINPPSDPLYEVSHVDDVADYYLGSGAMDDTFFVVFEPLVACSVYYAEIQWFDAGNYNGFAAWYSDEATAMYPGGIAPERGQSPVSPIGQWIAGPVPNSASGMQMWESLDLGGTEFICGNPVTLESDLFGVGFIKTSEIPRPLADGVSAGGIDYSFTWFGGPWMSTYPYDWGAYSSNYASTVVEVMMRVWVSYPWSGGGHIIIDDVFIQCDTYNTTGPFHITCRLEDETGIGPEDTVELFYAIDGGMPVIIPLEPVEPGSDYFYADIEGNFPVGSEISYLIHTVKENGLVNNSPEYSFSVIEPEHPDADVLFVDDGIPAENLSAYTEIFEELGIYHEYWHVGNHQGIDASVIDWGWNNIFVIGWGVMTVPVEDEETPYRDFLNGGGHFCLIDQDYFYSNGMPAQGTVDPGDFAYDYLGLAEYENDPFTADENYLGIALDPITDPFESSAYETYWDGYPHMDPGIFWADYVETGAGEMIFFGESDGEIYGVKYDNGFKTVFLSFMAEASCEYNQTTLLLEPSADLTLLMHNIAEWFGIAVNPTEPISLNLIPESPSITIPPGGGSFTFDFVLDNASTNNYTVDVWTDVTLPSGVNYPIITRSGVLLGAGVSIVKPDIQQFLPGTAVGGMYAYNAYIRDHQTWELYAMDSFEFEKLGADGSISHDHGWQLFGWGITDALEDISTEFSLNQNYPNPFNPETVIIFTLPQASEISLSIYNVKGQLVETLMSGMQSAGIHEITWNAEGNPSGMYFVRLSAEGEQQSVKKVVLTK